MEKYLLCPTEKLSTHCCGQTVWNNLLSETFRTYHSKNLLFIKYSGSLSHVNLRLPLTEWIRRVCISLRRCVDKAGVFPIAFVQAGPFTPNSFFCALCLATSYSSLKAQLKHHLLQLLGRVCLAPEETAFCHCSHLRITFKCCYSDVFVTSVSP